jgi:hypothetical protein
VTQSNSPIDAAEVAGWFRASTNREPWPDEHACEEFARRLEQCRHATVKNPTRQAKGRPLPKLSEHGREFLSALERRISDVDADVAATRRELDESTALNEERLILMPLRELYETMICTRHVWDPSSVKKRRHWHAWANLIAQAAISLWSNSGRDGLGLDAEGPLVKFVQQALQRTMNHHYGSSAIGQALRRTPALRANQAPQSGTAKA